MRLSCALQAHHSPQIFTVHQCGSCWNPELWVLRRHHYISMIDKNHWPFTPSSANLAFPKVEEWGQKFQPLITWLASQAVSPYLQVIFFALFSLEIPRVWGAYPAVGTKTKYIFLFINHVLIRPSPHLSSWSGRSFLQKPHFTQREL